MQKAIRALRRRNAFKLLAEEAAAWFCVALLAAPGRLGVHARRYALRLLVRESGSRVVIGRNCELTGNNTRLGDRVILMDNVTVNSGAEGSVFIGSDSSFNCRVLIDAAPCGEIRIGEKCMIGPNVVFRACNHRTASTSVPMDQQGHAPGKIVLGSDIWVGANVVILPNVTIGEGAVIGAGAVVTRDVPPHAIAVGVPARAIRSRLG